MLAFIAAEAREFAGLLRHCGHVARLDWPMDFARLAELNGRKVVLAANGPGPKLAARVAEVIKEHYELEGLVSTGFCGALSPALKPCDIFVPTDLLPLDQHVEMNLDQDLNLNINLDVDDPVAHALSVPRSHSCERQTGKLLSIDRVAGTAAEKTNLHQYADAIEMEAAGVARLALKWRVPFYAVKVVTDTASETFPLDFNRLRDGEGRFSRLKIVAAALRRPSAFPALLHLNERCNRAAQALGDFLADASF